MEQVPPHNLEAEQSVLAAITLDNQALVTVMDMLEPEDFYAGAHRVLFNAMREMFEKGQPMDLITLTDHLQATGRLEQAGGPATRVNQKIKINPGGEFGEFAGLLQ
ncbi:MAG: DnaB-like helicase N-terminal domain-containing protein [bacterium]